MRLPKQLILLPTLRHELLRPGQRRQRTARLLKSPQFRRRCRARLIHAVDLDPVRRARDMQPPVPGRAHSQWLRVERVVPATAHDLDPALDVARELELPRAPRPLPLRGQVLQRYSVPAEAAIGGQFDALGPAPAARVGPAFAADLARVDDDLVVPRAHDRGADGHLLNLDAVGGLLVVLAGLLVEVQVLLALHGRQAGFLDGFDPVQPLDAAGADVAQHDDPERVAVDRGQRLAVHFPGQEHLVGFYFAPRDADEVVHDLVILEISVGTVELEMLTRRLHAPASFDELLQADTYVFGRANGAFGPGSLRHLISLTGIECDLLNPPCTGALHGDYFLDSRKSRLVFKIAKCECARVVDQTIQVEIIVLLLNQRYASMITNKMQAVGCNLLCGHQAFWRFSVVWELE